MLIDSFRTHSLRIINSDEREIEGIVSAQMVDNHGEVMVQKFLLKHLQRMLDDNLAPIMLEHSNKAVGHWLEFWATTAEYMGREYPSIGGRGKLLKNRVVADEVWGKVEREELQGLSVGARTTSAPVRVDGRVVTVLRVDDAYEVSLCRKPVVPVARLYAVADVAKAMVADSVDAYSVVERDGQQLMVVQCEGIQCMVQDNTQDILGVRDRVKAWGVVRGMSAYNSGYALAE